MSKDAERGTGDISPELDALSSELMGDAFDILADGQTLNVRVVIEDVHGNVAPYEFAGDGPDVTLDAARERVERIGHHGGDPKVGLGRPVRYAIVYEGAVADESGAYRNAVLLEFGEQGRKSYSAYSYFKGRGKGKRFRWSEPAPAGEMEPLLH